MSAGEKLVQAGALAKAGHDFAMGNFAGEVGKNLPTAEEELSFVAGTLLKKVMGWLPRLRGSPEGRAMLRGMSDAQKRGEQFDPMVFRVEQQQAAEERYWNTQASQVEKMDREGDRQIRSQSLARIDTLGVDRAVVVELFEAADRLTVVRSQHSDAKYLYHSFYRNDLMREERLAYDIAARLQYRAVSYAESQGVLTFSKAALQFREISSSRPHQTPATCDLIRFSNHLALELECEYGRLPDEEMIGSTVYAVERLNRLLVEEAQNDEVKLTLSAVGRAVIETLQFASADLWSEGYE